MTDFLQAIAAQLDHAEPDDDARAAHGEPTYWEPWKPKVGDRVVISVNGECEFWAHWYHGDFRDYENGAVATVSRRVPLSRNQGHGYEVRFDTPYPRPSGREYPRLIGSTYAAGELIPVTDADDTARPSADVGRRPIFAPRQGQQED